MTKILLSLFIFLFLINHLLGQTDKDSLEVKLKIVSGKEKVDVLAELTEIYSENTPKKAIDYGKQALESLQRFPDDEIEFKALYALSVAYKELHEYKTALEYGEKARELAEKMGDNEGLSKALINNGGINYELSEFYLAVENYFKAIEIFKEIGNDQ
ncbi:MAG: tetratricopeptide repeat protein, partial [FCB group bacterium]|nr:tetratricopeptide repeat protein [FCB group bacterium]